MLFKSALISKICAEAPLVSILWKPCDNDNKEFFEIQLPLSTITLLCTAIVSNMKFKICFITADNNIIDMKLFGLPYGQCHQCIGMDCFIQEIVTLESLSKNGVLNV